ncbi:MAG: twin-arginine translocation signal domain-containing protein [Kiritimatiellae bacterium]|nr:twin-arginine translocation signal domain-containing protein [Kiritimatiellia bacterium]
MKTNMNRRDFLKGAAWMGAAAMAAGCQMNRFGFGQGGQMQDYAFQKLKGKKIRVGFVGIGSRGSGAVHRVSMIPGVDIVALCDKNPDRVKENQAWLAARKYRIVPKGYVGDEAYKDLCDFGECDVVYCATPWALHQPVALRALLGGKIALVEVTSALTVDESWELVEASEKWSIPCMQLENCVYGEIELLELNLARLGMFGEINHAEGAYIHDLREVIPSVGTHYNTEWIWRYGENMAHKGNRYPTHGLVPICQTMGINRGDRFDYLVSLENGPHNVNYEYFKKEFLTDADPRKKDPPAAMGDMNTTLIKTVMGKSIMVQHDVSSPRPYSRINLISGTRGIVRDFPFQCAFEDKCFDGKAHGWFSDEKAAEVREKYMHPMWRDVSDMAKKVGGHGGMDFIMDLRWAWCLQNGEPLDMDVYDLAATSCICELTETSVRKGSKPVSIPDFTRGNWRNVKPWGVVNVDLKKMGLDSGGVKKDDAALSV